MTANMTLFLLGQKVSVELRLDESSGLVQYRGQFAWSLSYFTITAEIHVRSLANFYCQYADRHMILKFVRQTHKKLTSIC